MKWDINFFQLFFCGKHMHKPRSIFNQPNTILNCKFRTFAILESEKKKREKERTFLNIV